ncbi:MAG TPA: hypothetical protein VIO58_14585 [Candidatus Methanoperedens sp.]
MSGTAHVEAVDAAAIVLLAVALTGLQHGIKENLSSIAYLT